jgi:hypothetical protein
MAVPKEPWVYLRRGGPPIIRRPVRIFIDGSADGRYGTYVALIVDGAAKPRVIYGVAPTINYGLVEKWAINRAIRRVNQLYNGARPIRVYTDNQGIAESCGSVQIRYRWLPRGHSLIRQIHNAATALRLAQYS